MMAMQGVICVRVQPSVCRSARPDSFAVGDFRRSRMAQVAAAFWRHDSGFDVICFRSVADYAYGVAEPRGTEPIGALTWSRQSSAIVTPSIRSCHLSVLCIRFLLLNPAA
jgi:hypothetical protein